MVYYIASKNELMHYGTLGMKWGIRKYQNKDGSYTALGKGRYNDSKDRAEKAKTEYRIAKNLKDKDKINQTREEYKKAIEEKKQAKKDIKKDKYADAGKYLYDRGYINNDKLQNKNIKSAFKTTAAVSIGAAAVSALVTAGITSMVVSSPAAIAGAAIGAAASAAWKGAIAGGVVGLLKGAGTYKKDKARLNEYKSRIDNENERDDDKDS